MSTTNEASQKFEVMLINALKIPGVKVDRDKFLKEIFVSKAKSDEQFRKVIIEGPVKAGFGQIELNKIASSIISKRTAQSASVSFAAGIPGGLAIAATIPGDVLQFFGMALRLAQELAYVYGTDDLWDKEEVDSNKVRNELTLFLGVMFGVGGSTSALRLVSSGLSKQALKKLPQQALTKTIYYPIIKKICGVIGIKVTKDSFAKSVSKVIPVIGGLVSGGITLASMKPMGTRLKDALEDSQFDYSQKDMDEDINNLSKETGTVIDVSFKEEIKADMRSASNQVNEEAKNSIADELLKYKELLDLGALDQEEFDNLKKELLKKVTG